MIPLDKNESYWMLGDELVAATHATSACELSMYPDYQKLKEALAAYSGVTQEHLLITPGSDAAIQHIARAYASGSGEVLLPAPTFYGYESILDRVGAKVVPTTYEERDNQFVFPLAKTLETLKRGSAKALFLCHPNNPLGCPLSEEDIKKLVEAARASDTVIVSDEAYFEFSASTSFLPYLAELPNLIIVRTLSKAFALSGARVGYAIASPIIVKQLEKLMLPWPIAHLSVTAALALLGRTDEVTACRKKVITERAIFVGALNAIHGIITYPSETNFVLVRVPDAERTRDELLSGGVRVAIGESMSHFPEAKMLLRNTLRIAIPSSEDSQKVIDILRSSFTG